MLQAILILKLLHDLSPNPLHKMAQGQPDCRFSPLRDANESAIDQWARSDHVAHGLAFFPALQQLAV